jgi:hypothetical protein
MPFLLPQVNKLEITTDKRLLAAAGNPQIRLYEVQSNNNQPVLTYDGHTANVTAVRLMHSSAQPPEHSTMSLTCKCPPRAHYQLLWKASGPND